MAGKLTLAQLKLLYPRARYEPQENCLICNGAGLDPNQLGLPCACLYLDPSAEKETDPEVRQRKALEALELIEADKKETAQLKAVLGKS